MRMLFEWLKEHAWIEGIVILLLLTIVFWSVAKIKDYIRRKRLVQSHEKKDKNRNSSNGRLRAQIFCSGTKDFSNFRYLYRGVQNCEAVQSLANGSKICLEGCLGLGSCIKACPRKAIRIINGVATVDFTKCVGCGLCVDSCPRGLIRLIPYDAQYWIGCCSHRYGREARTSCMIGCTGCHVCEKVCKVNAIAVVNNIAVIDYEKCNACGLCAEKCPRKIIWNAADNVKFAKTVLLPRREKQAEENNKE